MENCMDKEQQRKIRKRISMGTMLGLVLVLAILVAGIFTGKLSVLAFQIIACLYLLCYWAATDILEPKLTKELEDMNPAKKTYYLKYIGMDLFGYVGIMFFIIASGIGKSSNIGMFGIFAYALSLATKRKFKLEYRRAVNGESAPKTVVRPKTTWRDSELAVNVAEEESEQETNE